MRTHRRPGRRRRGRGPRCRATRASGPVQSAAVWATPWCDDVPTRRSPAGATAAELDGGHDRHVEQRAGRGPHDLRVEHVDGARREHDGVGAGRLGRAQDRAEVARVGEPVGDDDERRRRRARPARSCRWAHDGEHRLGRLGRRRSARRRRRRARAPGTPPRPACRRRPAATNWASTCQPAATASAEHDLALDDERALLGTRTAAPEQAPQSLDLWVAGAQHQPWTLPGVRPGRLGGVDERAERRRVGDGEVGEDLAVDLDAGRVEPGDEPAVAACRAGGRRR